MTNLDECREKIDQIDHQMLLLFCERMKIVTDVASYKIEHHLPVLNQNREDEIIRRNLERSPKEIQPYVQNFFESLMKISRSYQEKIIEEK